MITPNGGVFGRNPKFNNVTVDGNMTVNGDLALGDDITIADTLTVNGLVDFNGGLKVTPNASAPESNIAIGPSAGANLVSGSVDNVVIGSAAGDNLAASGRNIAIGTNALGAFSAGAAIITTSAAGSGGTPGTYDVTLEKDSGSGVFSTYPTVRVTVAAGGTVVANPTILTPGSGATATSGIVMRAVSYPAGLPTDWRGTLFSVTGGNISIGHAAGQLISTATGNTTIGTSSGDAITTGVLNTLIGLNSGGALTTGSQNVALGADCLTNSSTNANNIACGYFAARDVTGNANIAIGTTAMAQSGSGSSNVAIGGGTLQVNGTGLQNVAIGPNAFNALTNTNNNVAVGFDAGRYRGTSTDTCTAATDSIFIGVDARPSGNSESNQIVIGKSGRGDGANTTVLGTAATTSTRISGTATSALRVDGDTVRIVNDKTPASAGAAGNEGDICWDANYIYVCVAANTWKRAAIATWP